MYLVRRNSYPSGPLYNDGDWEGGCAAFRYVVAGYPDYYPSAYAAYLAAKKIGKLDLNPGSARPGEEHYWSGVKVRGVEQGHVAGETGGNILLMASDGVTTNFGHNSGLVAKSTYERAHPWLTYLGHAPRFGKWPAVVTSTAALGSHPLDSTAPPLVKGSDDMELYGSTAPSTVPAKYLALNSGLVPGKPIYMWLPSGGLPRVTQDQTLVSRMSQQQFNQASAAGIVQISWGWFDQLFDQQTAAYGTSSPAGAGVVDLSPLLAKLDEVTAAVLAPETVTKKAG